MDVYTFIATADEAGERVDKVAATRLKDVSRSIIKRWILEGRVEIDGATAAPKTRLREGNEVEVTPAPPEVPNLVPQAIAIDVLYEDEHLLLVDKPAGLVVHPAPGHPDGTLVNALLYWFGSSRLRAGTMDVQLAHPVPLAAHAHHEHPETQQGALVAADLQTHKPAAHAHHEHFETQQRALIAADLQTHKPAAHAHHEHPETQQRALIADRSQAHGIRPGIVHRLDKDTSGVMVVAKTPKAHEGLVNLFSEHHIERTYIAFVWGSFLGKRSFDTFHGRHPHDRKRFTSKTDRGRRAVTHVEAIRDLGPATEVRCTLETGRTHQIRVHLSDNGYPLVGDPVYGRAPKDEDLRALGKSLGRQALHAAHLGFVHPITGKKIEASTPLPEDIQSLAARLATLA